MTLRTPRRRISPRTKRRYRAIREFFRRALGSSSQPDIQINSSIAVNVTDLKRKIIGLEHQLGEVSRHCRDISCLDTSSRRESEIFFNQTPARQDIVPINEQTETSTDLKLNGVETEVIYKSKDTNYNKISEESVYSPKANQCDAGYRMISDYNEYVPKVSNKIKKVSEPDPKLRIYKAKPDFENFKNTKSITSFQSITIPQIKVNTADYSGYNNDTKHSRAEYTESVHRHKERKHMKKAKVQNNKQPNEDIPTKSRKHKRHVKEVDTDFIADIIRRQYKPVKMFGRRESDLSQFSAPVCRDQEYSLRENIIEASELCSCCYDRHPRHNLSDMRSICDTRLYSSKRRLRPKYHHINLEHYNDSDLYDLVPVKEKSSPKAHRKFIEENMAPYAYYREVPPSPRTLRPRLNLKAQYNTESEDCRQKAYRRASPNRTRRHKAYVQETQSDVTSDLIPSINNLRRGRKSHKNVQSQSYNHNQEQCPQDDAAISGLQYTPYVNQHTNANVDTNINQTRNSDLNVDKTDKALCEIKDILQSFLLEIKRETTGQCNKSEASLKNTKNVAQENSANTNNCEAPNNANNNNNTYSISQIPSYMPSPPAFTNPCCYPLMSICPINCPMPIQNSYVMPTQSFTCANCANSANAPKEHQNEQCNKNIDTVETRNTECEALIKEIYKFVAQGSTAQKNCNESRNDSRRHDSHKVDGKVLTSRSAGASSLTSRHDAKVGTQPLRCYSKSCEAIGSKLMSDGYYSGYTNASYSDTLIEKIGLETTTSGTELGTDSSGVDKSKRNKFQKVLNSFGLFKKKKKDVIEELNESESTIEVEVMPQSPYRQNLTSYVMHGQEYYHPPPLDPYCLKPHGYPPGYHPPCKPGVHEYPPIHEIYPPKVPLQRVAVHPRDPHYSPKRQSTVPPLHSPYDAHYSHYTHAEPPQVCLKEIEVRSTGTQSERKMSIFHKITKKMQPPPVAAGDNTHHHAMTCSTQTNAETNPKPMTSPFFNKWKHLKEKAMEEIKQNPTDAMNFSLKKQKELAVGDIKMRNAMLKKLFMKRNPFSPRNLLVKTLMGKDKSSYGDPRMSHRPRMFL